MKSLSRLLLVFAVLACVLVPALALAGPRSGGSFGGRMGFRSGGGMTAPRGYSGGGYGRSYGGGGGPSFFFFPGFGWGGYGYGGGASFLGTLAMLAIAGVAVVAVTRALRRARYTHGGQHEEGHWDDEPAVMPGRAYVYKLQLALGRSARGLQDRLNDFAARGDTATEAGLASLLQQTALELLREKDAVRYAAAEGRGPMSLTNAETAMNGVALSERARFHVERVRGAEGRVVKSEAAAEEGKEALELVVITLVVATRTALQSFKPLGSHDELRALLSELGGVPSSGLLGLEVVWTPADSNDSMTETDVMTTYPELRSL